MDAPMKYAELEIALHRQQAGDVYSVVLSFTDPDSTNAAEVSPGTGIFKPQLTKLLDPDDYGQTLTDQLFADAAVREAYIKARAVVDARDLELRLRLRIGASALNLQALRWELLAEPETKRPFATSERTLFSRYLRSSDYRPIRLSPKAALKALVAVSAPDDWQTFKVAEVPRDGEIARARAALEGIDIDVLDAPLTLERLLARLREQDVDVLYLVCHGVIVDHLPHLLLQKDDGTGQWTLGEELARGIADLGQAPRLAVLASCQSAGTEDGFDVRGEATAQSSLAPRLAEVGVPAIVAMQGNVTMETVEKAMPVFFRELLKDGQIDRAMAVARGAVRHRSDHWMPALYLRLKEGRLWRPEPAPGYRTMATPPDGFVHRHELGGIRELVCSAAANGGAIGITTALRGAGGFGKTTLAQALAFDDDVRAAYPDGVLWATMGDSLREGDRLRKVQGLLEWWEPSEKGTPFSGLEPARARLAELLGGRRVLVIVDDVWQSADVEAFRGCGTLLVTTRYGHALPRGCRRVDVDAMASREALELLGAGLAAGEEKRLAELAARLGEWPLLLGLVNRHLRELVDEDGFAVAAAVDEVRDELEDAGLTAFDIRDETARRSSVARTLEVVLKRLDTAERERFEELAVFPEDADVPVAVVGSLWGLGRAKTRRLCRRLRELSLLLRFDRQARTIRLHDVMRHYLIDLRGDALPQLHRRLLERCGCWEELPGDEEYLWRHLAYHLVEVGARDALRSRLFDFGYLEGKIAAADVNALLADYDVLGEDGPSRTLQGALRLSAHVVTKDTRQLAGQLLGRLDRHEPRFAPLLGDAARCAPPELRL